MAKINKNFESLKPSYLFAEIANRIRKLEKENPSLNLIKLGIGDVTLPLTNEVVNNLHLAVDDMANIETFKGYGPEQGYDFLRELILKNDYLNRSINIELDEIFVSDGAKSDCGNITDLFDVNNKVGVCDPVYPVYYDTNVMSGRLDNIVLLNCTKENNFLPEIPDEKLDLIYLCFPNNPTGEVATYDYLKKWVDYANDNGSVILYDSAYECFIQDENIPRSIFEVEGANTCAIEFKSFSKNAGFTGLRCAYTVIPKDLVIDGTSLNKIWLRRQCTKFNGVPYIVQKAAAAVYTEEGKKQVLANVSYYLKNAKYIKETLTSLGLTVYGGVNSPYIWVKTPEKYDSWGFFDVLLNEANVVTTPGAGFGSCGEGYIRFSAFNNYEKVVEAMERVKKVL